MNIKLIIILFKLKLVLCQYYWNELQTDDGLSMAFTQIKEKLLEKQNQLEVDVFFILRTNENRNNPQTIQKTRESLENSYFNKANHVKFLIHGWTENWNSRIHNIIGTAYLDTGSYNIITVDWSSISSHNYPTSCSYLKNVGEIIADFIDFLNESYKIEFQNIEIVGHSLGAHISGFVGKSVRNSKIHKIIALDPAAPLFQKATCSERICRTDAEFVEDMHTNTELFGLPKPVGHLSFYPNGGAHQPGCSYAQLVCSHYRAIYFYGEAIRYNNFITYECNLNGLQANCSNHTSHVKMGASENFYQRGLYFVPVNSESPFGKGEITVT